MSMAEAIETLTKRPECEIDCWCFLEERPDGKRIAKRPVWYIYTKKKDGWMGGPKISKIAAEYANWLLNGKFNIESLHKNAYDLYNDFRSFDK